jgi:hypothetical protein
VYIEFCESVRFVKRGRVQGGRDLVGYSLARGCRLARFRQSLGLQAGRAGYRVAGNRLSGYWQGSGWQVTRQQLAAYSCMPTGVCSNAKQLHLEGQCRCTVAQLSAGNAGQPAALVQTCRVDLQRGPVLSSVSAVWHARCCCPVSCVFGECTTPFSRVRLHLTVLSCVRVMWFGAGSAIALVVPQSLVLHCACARWVYNHTMGSVSHPDCKTGFCYSVYTSKPAAVQYCTLPLIVCYIDPQACAILHQACM